MKKRSLLPVLCTLPAVTGLVCAALLLLCLRQPEPPDPLGPFTGWELLESACRALPGVVFTALLVCLLLLMAHRRLSFSAAALWAAGALALCTAVQIPFLLSETSGVLPALPWMALRALWLLPLGAWVLRRCQKRTAPVNAGKAAAAFGLALAACNILSVYIRLYGLASGFSRLEGHSFAQLAVRLFSAQSLWADFSPFSLPGSGLSGGLLLLFSLLCALWASTNRLTLRTAMHCTAALWAVFAATLPSLFIRTAPVGFLVRSAALTFGGTAVWYALAAAFPLLLVKKSADRHRPLPPCR